MLTLMSSCNYKNSLFKTLNVPHLHPGFHFLVSGRCLWLPRASSPSPLPRPVPPPSPRSPRPPSPPSHLPPPPPPAPSFTPPRFLSPRLQPERSASEMPLIWGNPATARTEPSAPRRMRRTQRGGRRKGRTTRAPLSSPPRTCFRVRTIIKGTAGAITRRRRDREERRRWHPPGSGRWGGAGCGAAEKG